MSKFAIGRVLATPGACRALDSDQLAQAITRHIRGDWGDMDDHDKQVNEDALATGERLLSRYVIGKNNVYVITERDRSATTVLLADEY